MSKNTAGYFYEARKIHRLFGLSALALLVCTVWMIWQDHTREWKAYQQQARDLELGRLRKELEARSSQVDKAALDRAREELKAASQALEGQEARVAALEHDLQGLTSVWYKADQDFRATKAETDAARYRYEEAWQRHGEHDPAAREARAEFDAWTLKVGELKLAQERALAARQAAVDELAQLRAGCEEARRKESALLAQASRLEKRIAALDHNLVNDWFRDQPGIDYMAPLIKLPRPLTPAGLTDDYNFVQVQKVDRCNACHVNIDRAGFESEAQPFRTHPRLDLYLASRSPHSMETFGCTTCHGGQGSSTDFLHAYHTPKDEVQAAEWQQRYGWLHFQEEHAPLWSFPMLPLQHVESSCRKCHAGRVELDGAPAYSRGKHVFERAGCWGCHKVEGFDVRPDPKSGRVPTAADEGKLPKVGPDLVHIGCKLTPEFTAKWLADPKGFRAHTRMPSFFGVAPGMTDEMRERESTEIASIVTYLFRRSLSSHGPEFPSGDVAKGKALIETVGCLACHTIGGEGAGRKVDLSKPQADFDAFGPDLGSIGSKTNQGWLFNWLKNPKHYFPGGRMPDLRLSDVEAADAAAYLMTLKDPAFEARPAPHGDPARMRAILEGKLRSKESQAVVDYLLNGAPMPAELRALPEAARPSPIAEEDIPVALGEHMLRRYGCNGCHVIPGFEDDKGIGAELTLVGSKDLGQVDFGFVQRFQAHGPFSENAARTRHAWLEQKVLDPRVFDQDRVKAPLDRLIMPKFGLSEEDARALTTFLLSLNKVQVPVHRKEALDERECALEAGRRIAKDANCTACHVMGLSPRLGDPAGGSADKNAWLAEHLLLNAKGEPERTSSAQDALERSRREKAAERFALLAPARTFLAQKPVLSAEARTLLQPRGVDPNAHNRLGDLLAALDAARRTDPFKPLPPAPLPVAGLGEGLPGRWIADRATKTSQEESGKFAPPFLMDLGSRVHADWLYAFLLDPAGEYARRGGTPIRPAVPLRMPTFGFTPDESQALVRFFAASSESAYPFTADPPAADDPAARKAAAFILAEAATCRSCHVVDGASQGPPVGPDLDHLHGRLRAEWLRRYIQAPERSQPLVVMPGTYRSKADGTLSDDDVVPDVLDNDPKRQLDAIVDYLLRTPAARK